MKKILTLILLSLSMISFSQKLPAYYIVGQDTIGITLSISQLQKIDNDEEMLILLKKSTIECDSAGKQYVVVIDDLKNQIAILGIKVDEQNNGLDTKDKMINNLKLQISGYEKDKLLCAEQSKDKDKVITNQKKDILKLKMQKLGGAILIAVETGVLTYLILFKL